MRTFEQTKKDVVGWAIDRKIIQNSKPETQLLKAISEIGELCDATIKNNADDIVDAVGDVLVCLVNYCEILDIDIEGCFESAYNQIKDRKGTLLPNGCYVKE